MCVGRLLRLRVVVSLLNCPKKGSPKGVVSVSGFDHSGPGGVLKS